MTDSQQQTRFVQADEFVIRELDTLKVIADPLRLEIIELIFDHAHTVKQVAHKLDMPASKLYYHFNLMEKHGLITVASTRMVSGIVEKSFQASARQFRVMKGLLTPGHTQAEVGEGVNIFVDAILDDAKGDIKQSAARGLIDLTTEDSLRSLLLSRTTARLTPQQAAHLRSRIRELMDEFKTYKLANADTDEQIYALIAAFYPTERGARPSQDADDD